MTGPKTRAEIDAEWARFCAMPSGAPASTRRRPSSRRNGDLPPVPGGIRDADGQLIAPDPATLPPDELDFQTLWLHPDLLFAQTCWGPMELGLSSHVQVVGQPSYDGFEGGQGRALFERDGDAGRRGGLRFDRLRTAARSSRSICIRGKRFTFNSLDSMSGIIGADARPRGDGRKPRHLLRAHRKRRASRFDRRRRRGQGGCRGDRLPLAGRWRKRFEPTAQKVAGRRLDRAAQGPAVDHRAPHAGRDVASSCVEILSSP